MKKILAFILVLLCMLGMVGCVNNKKQDELLKYSSEIITKLEPIEDAFNNSYKSVTGENYINDETTYTEFTENTVVLARNLSDKALEFADEINDEEILETHRIYINYASHQLNAIIMMISAIENKDREMVSTANEKLNEANNYALDYKAKIKALAKKYDLEILN